MQMKFLTYLTTALVLLASIVDAQISMTLKNPPLGVNGVITGSVSGLPLPASQYKVGILLSGNNGATWWDKTHNYPTGTPQAVVLGIPLQADYTFSITGWISDPNDLQAGLIRVIIVPQSWSFLWPGYQVEGTAYPANLQAATVASITVNRNTGAITQYPGGTAPAPAPPAPAPNTGAAALTITAFPTPGTRTPVSGRVTGLTNPATYKAVLYLQGGGTWWIKPQPGSATTLAADGTFSIANWASYPAGDVNFQAFQIYIIPTATAVVNVLGGALPQAMQTAAVASGNYPRGYVPPAPPPPAATPPAVSPVPPPPAAGGPTLVITAFPAAGAMTPVSGRVTGLTNPATYKAALYLQGGGTWWIKPQPGSATTLAADGTFSIANWASYPAGDVNFQALQIYIVPAATAVVNVLGGPLPQAMQTASVASGNYPRGYVPGGGAGASPPPPATTPTGTGTTRLTVNPFTGVNQISGSVSGLPGSGYKVALYVQGGGAWWGTKPQVGATASVGTDGTFTLPNWASDPNDANVQNFAAFLLPPAANAPAVLGAAAFPATLTSAAALNLQFTRNGGSASGTVAAPTPAASLVPVAPGAGELPWPPGPPGNKVGSQNGFINFAGYRWIVKNTGWRVGPGNNIFSADINHVWTDNWGLHMNIIPTQGCNLWTCSEVWIDHSLGYGTYLFRHLGPTEQLDPDVVWSPFFLWDDSGGAYNGFREIDFETARWGNAGDPTSSQFVLRPLQSGPMVPGWRTRYVTRQQPVYQGAGQGYGGCNDPGQDNFNNAAVTKTTCVLRWFPGVLQWFCADGFWTMNTFNNVPANRLLSSYTYGYPQYVPDQGDNRVHINLWLQNGAAPRWGRRTHEVITGFEFTKNDIRFPNLAPNANIAQRGLLEEAEETEDAFDFAARSLQTQVNPAQESSGDPTGQGLQATMSSLMAANSVAGSSYRQLEEADVATTENAKGGLQISGPIIAGTVLAGLVAFAAIFAAGYSLARYRPNLGFAKETSPDSELHEAGTRLSRVAPTRARTSSK